MNDLQRFMFYDKYAKYNYQTKKFETFEEAVQRSIDHVYYMNLGLPDYTIENLKSKMLSLDVFPSMRFFATAGEELKKHPQSQFNCSYMPMESIYNFSDMLFLLGLGIGVGFSVETHYIRNLPRIQKVFGKNKVIVKDSLEGWKNAIDYFFENIFNGYDVEFDVSEVRKAGTPLLTKGGFASGPDPFIFATEKIKEIVFSRQNKYLTTLNVYDICCYIASMIISGGVRRSAMICLFDEDDDEMFNAKSDNWYETNKQRAFANNSFVVTEPKNHHYWEKKFEQINNGFGEPGIFSRYAAKNMLPERRSLDYFGTNPCGEIVLKPYQFCNLSIANVRSNDVELDIISKASSAALWGTIMSSVDYFPYINRRFSDNQYERLIGVDLNGQRDSNIFDEAILQKAKDTVLYTNQFYSEMFKIEESAATTCCKPAGNSALFFDTASGIHVRYAPYYIRRVQANVNSPLTQFLIQSGVTWNYYNATESVKENTIVLDFYVKSPEGVNALKIFQRLNS